MKENNQEWKERVERMSDERIPKRAVKYEAE